MKTFAALVLTVIAIVFAILAATVDAWPIYIRLLALAAAGILSLIALYCWDPLGPFDPDADEHRRD